MGIFNAHWQSHQTPFKWALALCAALGIVVVLGGIMSALIHPGSVELKPLTTQSIVEFVRVRRTELDQEERRKPPEKPPELSPPPAQPNLAVDTPAPQTAPAMPLPNLTLPLQLDRGTGLAGFYQGSGDGDVVPLVRIEPAYPPVALNRGLEGWVKVGLQVTPQGTVRDAEIIDAQPAQVFNRAVLRAVMRWKFKPKIVNGEPVDNYVTQVIQFKLERK